MINRIVVRITEYTPRYITRVRFFFGRLDFNLTSLVQNGRATFNVNSNYWKFSKTNRWRHGIIVCNENAQNAPRAHQGFEPCFILQTHRLDDNNVVRFDKISRCFPDRQNTISIRHNILFFSRFRLKKGETRGIMFWLRLDSKFLPTFLRLWHHHAVMLRFPKKTQYPLYV